MPAEHCLGVHDVSNIYRVPLLLHHQGVTANTLSRLGLVEQRNVPMWNEWHSLAELVDSLVAPTTIAVVVTTIAAILACPWAGWVCRAIGIGAIRQTISIIVDAIRTILLRRILTEAESLTIRVLAIRSTV